MTIFDWQHERRKQGLPTLSTLVGPFSLGIGEWGRWCASVSRPMIVAFDTTELARAWFEGVKASRLADWACDWLNKTLPSAEIERHNPRRMTQYDLDQVWSRLSDRKSETAVLAYRVLEATGSDEPLRFDRLVGEYGVVAVLAGLCGLAPTEVWPALLVISRGATKEFREVVLDLERITVRLCLLPIAVNVSTEVWNSILADSSRGIALAREGLIELSGVTASELMAMLIATGVSEPFPHKAIVRLTTEGLAPAAAEAFVAAVAESRRPSSMPTPDEVHRSAAELFLYELLEAMPETRGQFEPNREMEFRHGPRAAEADLAAQKLKLVIEVDGGYYHLNAGQYRRDRRKDHAYQRHGYWVLRFLAEDVVEDSESILATILDAVTLRRDLCTPREST
jgi:Protein of unknown function (DUF559)